jgi:DNA modification methylase
VTYILTGDCLAVMPTLEAESVDAIVSDPPYGLAFMGKAWDHGVPGPEFWREAWRVAKPGAHLVAFGGTRTYHRLTCAIEDAGWEIRDCLSWLYGSGFPKSHNGAWGGTALKPAWEPIILARKPLTGTVASNVAQHGTGALNVDGCRIGTDGGTTKGSAPKGASNGIYGNGINGACDIVPLNAGRWPANVCLDEEAATFPESRFFYTAKASRREREAGLEGMPIRSAGSKNVGESSGRDPSNPRNTMGQAEVKAANHHPTVKPIALMRWLCRLVTPKGGLILDPFTGSGTTGCAAVLEGFRFVGIEREPEYAEIAEKRIAHWAGQVETQGSFL